MWQDLVIQQGATFEFKVQVVGGPSSLGDGVARMTIRPNRATEEEPLVVLTGLAIDVPTRIITIAMSAAQTAALDWVHPAAYDLELDAESKTWRVIEGTVRLTREVTF